MTGKVSLLKPYKVFLEDGLYGKFVLVLALQCSLLLWPLAYSMARAQVESRFVQAMLDEFSRSHHVSSYDRKFPAKRFRAQPGPEAEAGGLDR